MSRHSWVGFNGRFQRKFAKFHDHAQILDTRRLEELTKEKLMNTVDIIAVDLWQASRDPRYLPKGAVALVPQHEQPPADWFALPTPDRARCCGLGLTVVRAFRGREDRLTAAFGIALRAAHAGLDGAGVVGEDATFAAAFVQDDPATREAFRLLDIRLQNLPFLPGSLMSKLRALGPLVEGLRRRRDEIDATLARLAPLLERNGGGGQS